MFGIKDSLNKEIHKKNSASCISRVKIGPSRAEMDQKGLKILNRTRNAGFGPKIPVFL